jgi:Na+/H+ antiporter NhaD/arsenite permease-like protein
MKKNTGFAALKMIHIALLAGQVLFAGVIFYLVNSKAIKPVFTAQDRTFQLIAIVMAAAAYFIGANIFKTKLAQIRSDENSTTQEKFIKYRTACIIQWALLEAATLFCIISFFLIGNFSFAALAVLLIILFAMQAPAKSKMALQLGINTEAVEEL